jgi:hypothetical protein
VLRIGLLVAMGILVVTVFAPRFGGFFTSLLSGSESVTVSDSPSNGAEPDEGGRQELEIVTLLGFDSIPAILEPSFVEADEAEAWMGPNERVLGLSINGEHRAYSIPMLSRHEIVNDVVGGVPVAVTW